MKFFGTVRQKIFDGKSWYSLPPLIHKLFRYRTFSETQIRRVHSTKFFGTVRQKKFNKKSWHNSLKHKIFRYPKLVTHWRVPLRNFSALWDKKLLTKNRDTPPSPLIHKLFRYQKLCETKKGSSTKFFGTVREQIFYRKSWYSPHRHKVFRYPKLMKHWRVPMQKYSALWGKKFSTENLDTPSPLVPINFFATGHFLKHRSEGFLNEIFRHCETKNFWQRIVILPLPSYT